MKDLIHRGVKGDSMNDYELAYHVHTWEQRLEEGQQLEDAEIELLNVMRNEIVNRFIDKVYLKKQDTITEEDQGRFIEFLLAIGFNNAGAKEVIYLINNDTASDVEWNLYERFRQQDKPKV